MAMYARWPNTVTYINLETGEPYKSGLVPSGVTKCAKDGGEMVLASTVFLQCTVCHEREELPATVTMALFGAPKLPGF